MHEEPENANLSKSMWAFLWLLLNRAFAGVVILSFVLVFFRAVSAQPGDQKLSESLLFLGLVGGGAMCAKLRIDNYRPAMAPKK